MRRLWIALALLPAWAGAETITLKFESAAPRVVDVVDSLSARLAPTDPKVSSEQKVEGSGDQFVRVFDITSGNVAARRVRDLSGSWVLKPADYSRVAILQVRVDQGGKPLPLGSVTVGEQTQLLTAESKGEATFYAVTPGRVKVLASYRDGEETRTTSQVFEVPLKRDLVTPELVVVVPAASVAPVAEPPPADDRQLPPPKATPPPTGLLGNLIAMVFAGAAALAILFFGLRWIYGNQDKTKDALGKLGVQIPDPMPPSDPAPSASPITPPAPPTPILLDPAPDIPVAPAAQVLGEPKLVGSAGSFTLSDGVHLVGREAGLTIALVGESTVSRQHAEIVCQGDSIIVRDLGSTNGTFVNGARLTDDHSLKRGDRVQFGSVMFDVR